MIPRGSRIPATVMPLPVRAVPVPGPALNPLTP